MGVVLVDSSEFNRLIEKYIDVVFRSALSFCQNKSDAEGKRRAYQKVARQGRGERKQNPVAFGLAQKGRFVQQSGC